MFRGLAGSMQETLQDVTCSSEDCESDYDIRDTIMCDTNNNNNYSLLFCRLTVIAVIISYGIFDVKNQHRVDATTVDNDNRRKQRLVPRFLNGHYVTWPADDHGGTKSRCDADAPPPKPPHAYYTPDNVVFTRMQMAGDRAFVVSPRYKYVASLKLYATTHTRARVPVYKVHTAI